jgi:hypothetical protein
MGRWDSHRPLGLSGLLLPQIGAASGSGPTNPPAGDSEVVHPQPIAGNAPFDDTDTRTIRPRKRRRVAFDV